MLHDGKIVKVKTPIPFKEHKQISSIINYLVEVHGYKTLQPYFAQNLDSALKKENIDNYAYSKVNKIHSMMNLSYISDYQMEEDSRATNYLNFYSESSNQFLEINGYNYVITDFNFYQSDDENTCKKYLLGEKEISVCFNSKKQQLTVVDESKKDSSLMFNMTAFLENLQKNNHSSNSISPEQMILASGNSQMKTKIIFNNIHFNNQENKITQLGMNGILFINLKQHQNK